LALVERQAAQIERYTHDRINAHSTRISALSDEIRLCGSRLGKSETAQTDLVSQIAALKELPKKVEAMESRQKFTKDLMQWVMGAVILVLALAGKVPWEVFTKVIAQK
jgi:hypothetical protein